MNRHTLPVVPDLGKGVRKDAHDINMHHPRIAKSGRGVLIRFPLKPGPPSFAAKSPSVVQEALVGVTCAASVVRHHYRHLGVFDQVYVFVVHKNQLRPAVIKDV